MGTDKRVSPDIFTKRFNHYDFIMLNSDGLTDYVRGESIHESLMNHYH